MKQMEWEQKTELVQAGNKMNLAEPHELETAQKNFHEVALKHIDSFDEQAWDMFINIVELTKEEIVRYKEFYEKFYNKLKEIKRWENISYRSALRVEYFFKLYEDFVLNAKKES